MREFTLLEPHSFEEAFEMAKELSGRNDIDVCDEDENAYGWIIFTDENQPFN